MKTQCCVEFEHLSRGKLPDLSTETVQLDGSYLLGLRFGMTLQAA
ncbi:Uncharacterised protein [Dermacoccus nishinomiyaensis]|nr:Uncharacterised protein [Dermacoccus nishinomiyaensis]